MYISLRHEYGKYNDNKHENITPMIRIQPRDPRPTSKR